MASQEELVPHLPAYVVPFGASVDGPGGVGGHETRRRAWVSQQNGAM